MNQPTLERRVPRRPYSQSPAMQTAYSRVLPLFGRVMLSSLFLVSALRIATDWNSAIAYASAQGFSRPEFWTGVTLAIDSILGLCLVAGYYTRAAALCLAGYLGLLTFTGHAFWTYTGTEYSLHLTHFMKNLSIIGGLFMVASYGPGRLGVDHAQRRVHFDSLESETFGREQSYSEKEI